MKMAFKIDKWKGEHTDVFSR